MSAPQSPKPPQAGRQGLGRYTWFLGVVGFLLITLVTINSINTEGVESGGPEEGGRLYPFAVPLAKGRLEGDANIATKDGQGELGEKAACSVRGPEILNICALYEKGPVVLAIFPSDGARCRAVLEQFQRVAPRFAGVSFAAVGSRGDRDELRGPWSFPVGWDRDGAVASRYGLVGCPQVSFARRGGAVVETTRRPLSDGEFAGLVRRAR